MYRTNYSGEELFEHAPVMLTVVDEYGTIITTNRKVREFSGKTKEELAGKPLGDGLGCIYRFDSAKGCGHSFHCTRCELHALISAATRTGNRENKRKLPYFIEKEGRDTHELSLLASASLLPNQDAVEAPPKVVILALEDLTDFDDRNASVGNVDGSTASAGFFDDCDASSAASVKEENERLLTEMNHRIKNNLANVEALAHLELSQNNKPKEHSINDIIGRVQAIGLVHEMLYSTHDFEGMDIQAYFENLCYKIRRTFVGDETAYNLNLDIAPIHFSTKDTTTWGIILTEMLTNTFKFAETESSCDITVRLSTSGDTVVFSYKDSGRGLNGRVRSIEELGTGTGLEIVKYMVDGLNGSIRLNTEDGTEFRIMFPAVQ